MRKRAVWRENSQRSDLQLRPWTRTYQGFDTEDTGVVAMLVEPDTGVNDRQLRIQRFAVHPMASNREVGPRPNGAWIPCGVAKGGVVVSYMKAYMYRALHPPMQSNTGGEV